MSNDLNLCQFIGRLGQDPELRYTLTDKTIASFSIACGWKGKGTEGTEWVRCVAWGKTAEIVGQYLTKGSQVYIAGRMQTRSYESNGEKKYTTEVIVSNLQMLGGKPKIQKPAEPAEELNSFDDDLPF